MATVKPVTVFFLQASRSIRTVWLLEELGVAYEVKFADRVNQKAPPEFKAASENPMGKFPTIKDGDDTVFESGNITEYLCDKYDHARRLLPTEPSARAKVNVWVHGAESTFMLFGLAVLYARWNFPAAAREKDPGALDELEAGLSANVHKAFEWLESTLGANSAGWLVGDHLTAADIMMQFSVAFLLERQLGTRGKRFPRAEAWLKKCEATDTYQRAVKKSGHLL